MSIISDIWVIKTGSLTMAVISLESDDMLGDVRLCHQVFSVFPSASISMRIHSTSNLRR